MGLHYKPKRVSTLPYVDTCLCTLQHQIAAVAPCSESAKLPHGSLLSISLVGFQFQEEALLAIPSPLQTFLEVLQADMTPPQKKPKVQPTLVTLESKPSFISLPSRALRRIIFYMRDPDPATPKNIQEPHKRDKTCRHSFIRPAFHLAITCKRLYTLYRELMTKPDFFGSRYLFSTACDPSICLTPLLNKVRLLRITGYSPFQEEYRCVIGIKETTYEIGKVAEGFRISSGQAKGWRTEQNEFWLLERELAPFLQAVKKVPVKYLEVDECFTLLPKTFWTTIANAWKDHLDEMRIHDTFGVFDQRNLSEIARVQNLRKIRLWSQAVSCIDPLANLTTLKHLSLRSCLIDDNTFEPVLRCLKNLELLDIADTCITPRIFRSLPKSLTALEAGDQEPYRARGLMKAFSTRCSCIAFTSSETEHLETCEQVNSGPLNPRWATKNMSFLSMEGLPRLTKLSWGHWNQYAQGIASLAGVIASLESLALFGYDFNDETISMLPCAVNLKNLRMYGCSVSDCSAYEIGRKATLQSLTIVNCPDITDMGLLEIADGSAARLNTLRSIILDESVQHLRTPKDLMAELGRRGVGRPELNTSATSLHQTKSSISQTSRTS